MTKQNKTYIGTTDEGERVFIEWQLKSKHDASLAFSASGYYLNAAGTDYSSGGQCIDQVMQDFPDSVQAREIHDVWKTYHLNDLTTGNPRQTELVETVIRPKVEKQIEKYDEFVKKLNSLDELMLNHCANKRCGTKSDTRKIRNLLYKAVIDRYQKFLDSGHTLNDYTIKGYTYYLTREGVTTRNQLGNGYMSVMVTLQHIKLIHAGYKSLDSRKVDFINQPHKLTLPFKVKSFDGSMVHATNIVKRYGDRPHMSYGVICDGLSELGRLHDPDHLVLDSQGDMVAYKYGSSWVTHEIPQVIIDQINSWVQVPEPDELTLVQQFAYDNGVTATLKNNKTPGTRNQWVIHIASNNTTYDYFTGHGISINDHQSITQGAISCLMSDATVGRCDDATQYLIEELGYEYSEAKVIAESCVQTSNKLGDLYDERLDL